MKKVFLYLILGSSLATQTLGIKSMAYMFRPAQIIGYMLGVIQLTLIAIMGIGVIRRIK